MNRFIIEEFYNDPAIGRRVYAAARLEQMRAIRAGLAGLFGYLKERFTLRTGPSHWIARLG